ncbi:MAG: acyltransferase [Bacteroidetes bacterium]|nr:acyltransferase [Bacteroidota bacterium]
MDYFIHHTAIADEGCQIGSGSRVWHFCHIMKGARIGNDCTLGQNVFVAGTVVLGNRVKVQNNVSLYDGVLCEDDVFVGPSAVFTNVINPRSAIERKNEYRPTHVHRGATIGANATILCGHEIGKYAMVGAGAVVTKNIPDYALVTGNPALQRGWVSEAGNKLAFDEKGTATCTATGEQYILENNQVRKTGTTH